LLGNEGIRYTLGNKLGGIMAEKKPTHHEPVRADVAAHAAPAHHAPLANQASGLAVAALVVGIAAVVFGWAPFFGFIVGAVAVTLGIIAVKKPSKKGMAIAGIITGGFGLLWNIVATGIFLVALAIGGGAAASLVESANTTAAENEAAAAKEYVVGDTITIENRTLTVTGIERNIPSNSDYFQPETGKEFVAVNVTITNESSSPVTFGTYDFKIQDGNGAQIYTSYIPGLQGVLEYGSLAANGKVSGKLGFQVPKDDQNIKLVFAPAFWSNNSVTVKL